MKKLLLLPLALVTSMAFAAPNAAIKALGQDLKSFNPASITVHQRSEKRETVVIILPQARITDTIYTAAIKGACMRLWLNPKDKYLNTVGQIAVLNQMAKQGYVFENPKETCKQMGEAVGNKSNILLMGNTRIY